MHRPAGPPAIASGRDSGRAGHELEGAVPPRGPPGSPGLLAAPAVCLRLPFCGSACGRVGGCATWRPTPGGRSGLRRGSPIQPSGSTGAPGSTATAALPVPPGADAAAPGAQPSAPTTAQDGGQPTTPAGPDATATAGLAPATCQDRDITVRVSPSALRVSPGGEVSFALEVSARGLDPCDVAGLTRTVQVADNAGPIWSSSRCGYPPTGPTVVRPGAPATFQVTWNTRSCGHGQLRAGCHGRLRRHRAGGRRQGLWRDRNCELTPGEQPPGGPGKPSQPRRRRLTPARLKGTRQLVDSLQVRSSAMEVCGRGARGGAGGSSVNRRSVRRRGPVRRPGG